MLHSLSFESIHPLRFSYGGVAHCREVSMKGRVTLVAQNGEVIATDAELTEVEFDVPGPEGIDTIKLTDVFPRELSYVFETLTNEYEYDVTAAEIRQHHEDLLHYSV